MEKVNKIFLYYPGLLIFFLILTNGCKKNEVEADTINFNPLVTYGSLEDQDGNIYKTVTIGTQIWMAENLKTTRYRNGDPVPNVTDYTQWENLTTGAYCNYDNNSKKADIYGRLYNWYAVNDSRNIAPEGWHVPSDAEWTILSDYLGGGNVAANKLMEAGLTHWISSNSGVTNESGFTALPGGYRSNQTIFYIEQPYHFGFIGLYGMWWSSTDSSALSAWNHWISLIVTNGQFPKHYGFSVRCIKDS